MGQYFKPVIIEDDETVGVKVLAWMYSHDHIETWTAVDGSKYKGGHGLKLMEHSYLGNNFVGSFASLLVPGGLFYKGRVVWAGDYADPDVGWHNSYDHIDSFKNTNSNEYSYKPKPEPVFCGGCANLYDLCLDVTKVGPQKPVGSRFKYVVNYSKNQFVDCSKVPPGKPGWEEYRVHPLPLLTCEGNGLGGGDYREGGENLIGIWARDSIGMESKRPSKDFEEIVFDLVD